MKQTTTISCGWMGDGKSVETAFRPAILADYPDLEFPTGILGDPLTDAPLTAEVRCDEATMKAISGDLKYAAQIGPPPLSPPVRVLP